MNVPSTPRTRKSFIMCFSLLSSLIRVKLQKWNTSIDCWSGKWGGILEAKAMSKYTILPLWNVIEGFCSQHNFFSDFSFQPDFQIFVVFGYLQICWNGEQMLKLLRELGPFSAVSNQNDSLSQFLTSYLFTISNRKMSEFIAHDIFALRFLLKNNILTSIGIQKNRAHDGLVI